MAFFFVCISSVLIISISTYVFQLIADRRRRLPPGPTPLPFIGNLLDVARELPHRSLARLAGRHGPLMTVRLGRLVTVVASSPSTARDVLQTHNGSLTGRSPPDAWLALGHAANSVFVLPPGRRWRALRRIGTEHLLSARRLDGERLRPLLRDAVLDLVRRVSGMTAAGTVEVGRAAFAAMMDLQWRAMFSAGLDDAVAARALHDAAREAVALSLKPNVSDFFPGLAAADLQGVRRRFARRVAMVYQMIDEQVERRMRGRRDDEAGGSRSGEKDLLDVMLDMSEQGKEDGVVTINRDVIRTFLTEIHGCVVGKEENWVHRCTPRPPCAPWHLCACDVSLSEGREPSAVTLRPWSRHEGGGVEQHGATRSRITDGVHHAEDIFLATVDTISSTIEWAMAELLQHPGTMSKLQKELRRVLGSKAHVVGHSDVERLPYLRAVIRETLRLHPVVPLVPNEAERAVEIHGLAVPEGCTVLVNLWAVHRDAGAWPEPDRFMPERFLTMRPEEEAGFLGTTEFEFIPFSAGRRVCLGLPLATRMVHAMLGSLMHRFEWTLPPEVKENGVDMSESLGLTMIMATPLQAIAKSVV